MDHLRMRRHGSTSGEPSVSEILADARDMQARHAPRVIGAAFSWLRGRLPSPADARFASAVRRLVVH